MSKTDTIASLRDLVPLRPLTHIEALRVAELQATRFLKLAGIAAPPVPEQIITELPRLRVERLPLGVPGASQWSRGRWVVLLNKLNTPGRQRFSLAHEFKHILDNPFIHLLYPEQGGVDRREWIEVVCDRFAVNLLMPRAWIKRAWAQQRIQRPTELARLFDVSLQAMRFRLEQMDLLVPTPRCNFPYESDHHKEDLHDRLIPVTPTR
jgi:Zn-dependent peptidase ImmA (M78 family)